MGSSPHPHWRSIRRGRWLRNVPRGPQTLEDSLSDGGVGDALGRSTTGAPLASRPQIPCPRFPSPKPPPYFVSVCPCMWCGVVKSLSIGGSREWKPDHRGWTSVGGRRLLPHESIGFRRGSGTAGTSGKGQTISPRPPAQRTPRESHRVLQGKPWRMRYSRCHTVYTYQGQIPLSVRTKGACRTCTERDPKSTIMH